MAKKKKTTKKAPETKVNKYLCDHCDYSADCSPDLTEHIRQEHPKKSAKNKPLQHPPIFSPDF